MYINKKFKGGFVSSCSQPNNCGGTKLVHKKIITPYVTGVLTQWARKDYSGEIIGVEPPSGESGWTTENGDYWVTEEGNVWSIG